MKLIGYELSILAGSLWRFKFFNSLEINEKIKLMTNENISHLILKVTIQSNLKVYGEGYDI